MLFLPYRHRRRPTRRATVLASAPGPRRVVRSRGRRVDDDPGAGRRFARALAESSLVHVVLCMALAVGLPMNRSGGAPGGARTRVVFAAAEPVERIEELAEPSAPDLEAEPPSEELWSAPRERGEAPGSFASPLEPDRPDPAVPIDWTADPLADLESLPPEESPQPEPATEVGEALALPNEAVEDHAREGAGSDDSPLDAPTPVYPLLARRMGWEGVVSCRLRIAPEGHVFAVDVLRSSGHAVLDDAAVAALERWRFTPGERTVTHEVEFRVRAEAVRTVPGRK